MIRIEQLFVSPGHNFFGHHGGPAGRHPILSVPSVTCVAGRGIEGDRFFDYRPDYKGQITFFAAEIFEALERELSLEGAQPSSLRRNVIIRGLSLPDLVDQEFAVQGVRFRGTEECRPCYWMNDSLRHLAAEEWLRGRGGLRARILSDGTIHRE